jgi:hypothetical protein
MIATSWRGMVRWSLAGLALALAMDCSSAEERYLAWLNDGSQASRISVTRNGQLVPYATGLRACDVVRRADANPLDRDRIEVVIVTLGGHRVPLTGSRSYAVSCDGAGADSSLVAFLKGVWQGADDRHQHILAAGRGKCDAASSGLDMPIIPKSKLPTMITSSGHPLELRWFGRFSPFKVEVRRVVDGKEAGPVLDVSGISGPHLSATVPNFAPGVYTITLTDACDAVFKEYDLRVVGVDRRPPIPAQLRGAALSETERAIWYANYLVAQGEGQWQLEAMQLVAALPERDDPRVRDWLAAWGDQ